MKTLYLISKGLDKLSENEMRDLEKEDKIPRHSLLEDYISADLLDERYLVNNTPTIRRQLYKLLPVYVAQLIEALFILHRYDIILSHTEKAGLPLALAMKIFGINKPHVIIISRITSVNEKKSRQKIWFLKKTKDSISKIIIWSSMQRKIAIEKLGVPADKIILVKRGTDQKFWRPQPQSTKLNMICAAGMEARDYPTLVEALRPLNIRCHIAVGASRGELFDTVKKLYDIKNLPKSITVGRKSLTELRDLYTQSQFVVVPIMQSDSDNGLTTILESMAMGKPVICSRTEGQIDVIQDGITGIFVPLNDPIAMREAILELWNDPERCRKMGIEARKYIEENHSLEQFANDIKIEIEQTIQETLPEPNFVPEELNV